MFSNYKDAFRGFEYLVYFDDVFHFAVLEFPQVLGEFRVGVLQHFDGNGHLQIHMHSLVHHIVVFVELRNFRLVAVASGQLLVQTLQFEHRFCNLL